MNILLIPGNSLSPDIYKMQLESELGSKHQFTLLDLNEVVGETDVDGRKFMHFINQEIVRLNELYSFDVIVGQGLGGHIAIEVMPLLTGVKGIMIFGTPPLSNPANIEDVFLPTREAGYLIRKKIGQQELVDLASKFVYGKKYRSFIEEMLLKGAGRIRDIVPVVFTSGSYEDEVKILADTKVPVAIIHGEKDKFVRLAYFETIDIPTLWRGEVQCLPLAGHCPQLEKPRVFNRLLQSFIEDVCFEGANNKNQLTFHQW